MLKGLRAQILILLVLLLAFSVGAGAQAFGRVTVVVKDGEGNPLQGVVVIVTCSELPRFREETQTNKKGKAIVSFTDATKVYDFRFKHEDFAPADIPIKPQIRGNITHEVNLSAGQLVAMLADAVTDIPVDKYNEGVAAMRAGDLATAKAEFLAALESNDNLAPAHAALARVYLAEKDYQAALVSIQRYLELEPGDPNGLFMLYDAHLALGNQDAAVAAMRALKDADAGRDTVALIYNAGVAALKVGDYVTAKARFIEAFELDPGLEQAVGALAILMIRQENYQEAAEYAEKHLALEPGNRQSLRIRWDAYTALGDEEHAKSAFNELAAVDPKALAVELFNKGNDLFDSGDTAGAITQFERVIELDPENALVHYRLGICLIDTDNSDQARQHLEKFIAMAPEDPEAETAKEILAYLN